MANKFNMDMFKERMADGSKNNNDMENEITNQDEIDANIKELPALNTLYPKDITSVFELEIDKLVESNFNIFNPIQGERWEEFKNSIKTKGILTPIIVRQNGKGGYEILAGHNRVKAAMEVGLEKVPAMIKAVDDLESVYIVADTNLQRDQVTDLEKGWAYRLIYDEICKKRNQQKNSGGQKDHELKSSEIIAEKYGIAEKTVRRKIRLTYLIPQLYKQYEKKLFVQDAVIHLSYLKPSEQSIVYGLRENGLKFDVDFAKAVKELSESSENPIGANAIRQLYKKINCNSSLDEEKEKKVRQTKYKVNENFIPENITKRDDKEKYINEALKYIAENNIKL